MALLANAMVPASASGSNSDINSVETEWGIIEEKIDESLDVVEGRYSYDEGYISSLIDSLDIESFNVYFGTEYTTDSLQDSVITNVKNAKFDDSPQLYRTWSTHNETIRWANDLNYNGDMIDNAGWVLTKIPLPFHWNIAVNLGVIIGSWYFHDLARALNVNNYSCGTVTDINKYTQFYTVNRQDQ